MTSTTTKPRIHLEKLTVEKHLDGFWDIWRNEEAVVWSMHTPKETREEALKLMVDVLPAEQGGKEEGIDKWAVILGGADGDETETETKTPPKMIGIVGTNRPSPQGLEFGYCMNYNYWGMGYASEAVRMCLDLYWWLESRKSIPHLVAKIDLRNVASEKVVRKMGARKGEELEGWYARGIDGGVKSNVVCWYIDRPEEGKEVENGNVDM